MTLPTLTDVRAHLNDPAVGDDSELQGMLDAAVEVIGTEIGMSPVDITGRPALRLAIIELVRDIWSGTQSGGGGQAFGQPDGEGLALFTAGRPVLPPYVLGLLRPYRTVSTGPAFSFPVATELPF